MRIGLAMAAALLVVAALPAQAQTPALPGPLAGTGCEEHQAWVDGDAKAVAARLPKGYTAVTDNGSPLLFARAMHCDALDGAPVTIADWGIVVQTPDGGGCASGIPTVGAAKGDIPPACNWYTRTMLTDSPRLADWLRQSTPGLPVRKVDDLVLRRDGDAFHFDAGAADFTIDDTSQLRPGEISLRGGYWFEIPQGTVRMGISTDDLSGGHADSVVRAAPGSDLATLMGATSRSSVEPYSDFGVIRAGHGVLRKQLLGPALSGEHLDTFAGSCSVQGDVTFDPPATNNQAATFYTYDSRGTCTGTLNGRTLDSAPVRLTTAGHSDASCMRAMTFPPGDSAITFPDGTRLPTTLDFTSKATELDGTFYGTRSGSATVHSTFLTQRTPPDVPAKCAGDGVRTAPMDLTLRTAKPLVSSTRSESAAAVPERLRVSSRPRRVRARRRTTLTFRVTTLRGRAVPGALVRFAGRRARTGAAGTARITVSLRRRGLREARASLPGFSGANATVVVVRR
jgi:hypothetical protein